MGGQGVVIWRDADEETRERLRKQIAAEPGGWIGQELVQLSVHPTVVDGRLEPRHVDLRRQGHLGARTLKDGKRPGLGPYTVPYPGRSPSMLL
jgi:hypothetical protein